jgi:hypothetical protein
MVVLESQKEDDPKCFFVMNMGTQIPVITEKPISACGCRKFQLDTMGDHLCTCTSHSVTKIRGRHCGDIELVVYLANSVVDHSMRLPLTRSESIDLTTIIT